MPLKIFSFCRATVFVVVWTSAFSVSTAMWVLPRKDVRLILGTNAIPSSWHDHVDIKSYLLAQNVMSGSDKVFGSYQSCPNKDRQLLLNFNIKLLFKGWLFGRVMITHFTGAWHISNMLIWVGITANMNSIKKYVL